MVTDRALIEKLAALARLELSAAEVDRLTEQLPKILDYVGQLQRVETTRIESVKTATPFLRADVVAPSSAGPDILGQAPERSDRFWKVDAVFS